MKRRQLFETTAKAALATAIGGSVLADAKAQTAGPGAGATPPREPIGTNVGWAGGTTTIPGNQLPPPDPKFGGVIKDRASESTPWWPPRVVPPKGAPNVLLIMPDDCGFGTPATFGGVVPTPALDRVAKNGLRYTNFHSTSLCSPTRAALITGRNHHVAGFGVVDEIGTGYPGYNSIILKANGTVGTIMTGGLTGIRLWPAAVLHLVPSALLARAIRQATGQ